jgi:hypothetical protein
MAETVGVVLVTATMLEIADFEEEEGDMNDEAASEDGTVACARWNGVEETEDEPEDE